MDLLIQGGYRQLSPPSYLVKRPPQLQLLKMNFHPRCSPGKGRRQPPPLNPPKNGCPRNHGSDVPGTKITPCWAASIETNCTQHRSRLLARERHMRWRRRAPWALLTRRHRCELMSLSSTGGTQAQRKGS